MSALRLLVTRSFLLLLFATGVGDLCAQAPREAVIEVRNGRWFNGSGFDDRTFYIREGRLESTEPPRVDSVLDLQGGFVIPPFGDAHTHNLDGEFGLAEVRAAYIEEGTFYVQVLTNTTRGAAQVRSRFDDRCSLDVVYANGGLTSTLSHPFLAYEPRAMGLYSYSGWEAKADDIRASRIRENDAYWFIDTKEDLASTWPRILAADPGVIKVFLLDAAEVAPDVGTRGLPQGRGLRPSLVPDIVSRADRAGLRVAAHVETAADLAVAVRAGVDILAHLPGYDLGSTPDGSTDARASTEAFELPDEIAREAGESGVVVTPTVSWTYAATGPDSAQLVRRRHDLMRRNLAKLRDYGVPVVVGSDWYGATAWHEVRAMRTLGVWSDLELLRMWAVDTPRSIFPDRRIGRLEDGYEASFLVLRDDPTHSIDARNSIELRVKQGCSLDRD